MARNRARLQPACMWDALNDNPSYFVFKECPNWGTTNNNGNVQGVTVQAGGPGPLSALATYTGTFTYDPLNRLATASDSGGWTRKFQYDQYGNMWVWDSSGIELAGNTPRSNVYTPANQISGTNYDVAGNQLSVNGDTAAYDAENRQISVTEPPSMGGGTET
ncbi:MAG TPA: RHS repeat domain-containing protein, partial [Bryobacteraceae bacterium]